MSIQCEYGAKALHSPLGCYPPSRLQPNMTLLAFDKFVMNASQKLEAGQGAKCSSGETAYLYRQQELRWPSLPAVPTIVFILAVRVIWAPSEGPDAFSGSSYPRYRQSQADISVQAIGLRPLSHVV